ncbi:MAK10-like protein [Tanacetum coccineum]
MGDENPICTLGDYSKPSHEGYRNTIELPVGNNVVPLRSDTIRKECACIISIFLPNQASNYLERLPAGSITTWEDLTTRFLAQFFLPGRTAKLRNDILMFQQSHISILTSFVQDNACRRGKRHNIEHDGILGNHSISSALYDHEAGMKQKNSSIRQIAISHLKARTPEKVLIREEAKFPVAKNVNSISLTKGEEERSNKKEAETKNGAENGTENKSIKTPENEEAVEAPGSQPVTYYLKHKINEKLIEGLGDNNRFNNSLSGTRVRKKKGKTYKVLPRGPVYDAILKKKITKKEDIRGNL